MELTLRVINTEDTDRAMDRNMVMDMVMATAMLTQAIVTTKKTSNNPFKTTSFVLISV